MASSRGAMQKPPPHFSESTTFISIFVGSSAQKFLVHKNLLIFHSPYFDRKLKDSLEGRKKNDVYNLQLLDVPEKVFGLFNHWLYTQTLCHAGLHAHPILPSEMAELWMLGRHWQIPGLQNAAMSIYGACWDALPNMQIDEVEMQKVVDIAYSAKEETLLQKRLVQTLVCSRELKPIKEWMSWFPVRLKDDLLKGMMWHFRGMIPQEVRSDYYV